MKCKYCGADITEKTDFCPKCGGIVDAEETDEKEKGSGMASFREKSSRGGMTGLIIALVIVASLLLACLAAALLDYFGVIDLPFIDFGPRTTDGPGVLPDNTGKAPTVEPDPDKPDHWLITVYAKAGTTLIYESSDGTRKTVEVPEGGRIKFSVARSALMPNEPIDGETCQVVPTIYTVDAEGGETLIEGFEPITLDVPELDIRFDNSDAIDSADGSAVISGSAAPSRTEITVEGVSVAVGEDGSFSHTLSFSEAGEHTVALEARCPGYRIFRHSFTVTVEAPSAGIIQFPWEYGDDTFTQRVKNDADTPLEVRGRVPAGSIVTASCENPAVTMTVPTVDDAGVFVFTVTMPEAGDYEISISCAAPSGELSERVMHIQRAPDWRAYVEGSWAMTYEALCYASKQAYKISGTVTEIVEDGDCLSVMLELEDGRTIMLRYYDHYPNAGSLEVGSVHTGIYGHSMGRNEDGVPVIYVWFVID